MAIKNPLEECFTTFSLVRGSFLRVSSSLALLARALTLKKPWSDKTAHATLDACHFVSSSDMILETQCKFLFWCLESVFNLSLGVA